MILAKLKKLIIIAVILTFGGIAYGQTIIVDPITYEIKILDENTGKEVDTNNNNGITTPGIDGGKETTTSIIQEQNDPTSPTTNTAKNNNEEIGNQEFEKALDFMYKNKMTMFNTTDAYQPYSFLTREQFAKIINRFYKISDYPDETKNTNCNFKDIASADPTLQEHIKETCRLGIFKGYSDNTFKPFKQLTKAEFIAVTIRIYDQKLGDETQDPRWIYYYKHGQELGVLDDRVDTMDTKIDRKSAAVYLRRLYNIKTGDMDNENQGPDSNESNKSQDTKQESNILKNISILGEDINPQNDPQIKEAIHTMYENKMIPYDRVNTNFLYANTTREEVAKILDIFGDKYIKDYPERKSEKEVSCVFNDVKQNDENYNYINNACKMGIMLGDNDNNFLPKNPILKSQFITALVRLIEGKLNENILPWRQNYFDKAREWGIINEEDKDGFENSISNIEMILYLHRLVINNIIAQNLDYTPSSNEFMIVKNHNDNKNIQTYIDINFLRTLDNKVGYITRENSQWKVQKTDIQEYPNFHIVRYGEIRDTVTNEAIGSVMFITDKKHLLNGTVRLSKEEIVYTIQPLDQNPFEYTITEESRQ